MNLYHSTGEVRIIPLFLLWYISITATPYFFILEDSIVKRSLNVYFMNTEFIYSILIEVNSICQI